MLKLMKYEFRKMRTTLACMMAALIVLQVGFLIGDKMDNYKIGGVCIGLLTALVFAVYIYILIAGIVSYSRELNDRTGYMTFMTPVSPLGVVISKLLFTILASLIATALFGAAVYYDYSRLFSRLQLDAESYNQINFAFSIVVGGLGGDISLIRVILNLAFETGSVLISIMLLMCTAYLAITLSATLLQNKRGFVRLLVSFLLFVALNYITSKASGLVASDIEPKSTEELLRLLGAQAAVDFAFAAVFAGVSAWLLDRKVSL